MNALYICMTPLTPENDANPQRLADLARETAAAGKIDPVANLADDRVYIFTGNRDEVVGSIVVHSTRQFYEALGVKSNQIKFIDTVPAGHSIITDNAEDSPLGANQPPYINNGGFMQSHDILRHIYGDLKAPAGHLSGELIRFDQFDFLGADAAYASMGRYGYVYVPEAVKRGATARGVHIVLHGCKQGYSYVNYMTGLAAITSQPPYGNRYMTTTGYNQIADSNNIIVLYPQVTGDDDNKAQNPDGCWDWWGYTSAIRTTRTTTPATPSRSAPSTKCWSSFAAVGLPRKHPSHDEHLPHSRGLRQRRRARGSSDRANPPSCIPSCAEGRCAAERLGGPRPAQCERDRAGVRLGNRRGESGRVDANATCRLAAALHAAERLAPGLEKLDPVFRPDQRGQYNVQVCRTGGQHCRPMRPIAEQAVRRSDWPAGKYRCRLFLLDQREAEREAEIALHRRKLRAWC